MFDEILGSFRQKYARHSYAERELEWEDFERWHREVEELCPTLTKEERGEAARVAYAMLPKYLESSAHEYVFAAYCCSLLLRSGDCSSDVLTHIDRLRAVYGTTKTDLVKN